MEIKQHNRSYDEGNFVEERRIKNVRLEIFQAVGMEIPTCLYIT
jgi:hypothetical protein